MKTIITIMTEVTDTIEQEVNSDNYPPISIEQLKQEIWEKAIRNKGYPSRKLSDLFNMFAQTTPNQYITERKLNAVLERILRTIDYKKEKDKIIDFSHYSDERNMIKAFTNQYKCSPAEAHKDKRIDLLTPKYDWNSFPDAWKEPIVEKEITINDSLFGISIEQYNTLLRMQDLQSFFGVSIQEANAAYNASVASGRDAWECFEEVSKYKEIQMMNDGKYVFEQAYMRYDGESREKLELRDASMYNRSYSNDYYEEEYQPSQEEIKAWEEEINQEMKRFEQRAQEAKLYGVTKDEYSLYYRLWDYGKGYDDKGYDFFGFNKEGIDQLGFNKDAIHQQTGTYLDPAGFNHLGFNERGFNRFTGQVMDFFDDYESEITHSVNKTLYYKTVSFDEKGYDKHGFNKEGKHKDTNTFYDADGYDIDGFNQFGFTREGFHLSSLDKWKKDFYNVYDNDGYDEEGYDRNGFNRKGFNRRGIYKGTVDYYDDQGFDRDGYDRNGLDITGRDRNGCFGSTGTVYDADGFDINGLDMHGFNREGFSRYGYDRDGYDRFGFNAHGFNRKGVHRETGTAYNPHGFDCNGFDKDGFNSKGYDKNGLDKDGFDKDGYDKEGYNRKGFNRINVNRQGENIKDVIDREYRKSFKNGNNGYDADGYDIDGYDRNGYDRDGYDRDGYNEHGFKKLGNLENISEAEVDDCINQAKQE